MLEDLLSITYWGSMKSWLLKRVSKCSCNNYANVGLSWASPVVEQQSLMRAIILKVNGVAMVTDTATASVLHCCFRSLHFSTGEVPMHCRYAILFVPLSGRYIYV